MRERKVGVEKVCFIKHYTVIMLSESRDDDDDYDDMEKDDDARLYLNILNYSLLTAH